MLFMKYKIKYALHRLISLSIHAFCTFFPYETIIKIITVEFLSINMIQIILGTLQHTIIFFIKKICLFQWRAQ